MTRGVSPTAAERHSRLRRRVDVGGVTCAQPILIHGTMGVMADLATRAQQLLDLHHSGTTLVLPTVWDAWSAKRSSLQDSPR